MDLHKPHALTTVLALFLAIFAVIADWRLSQQAPGIDFYQFWVVARSAGRDDLPNIYADQARAQLGAEYQLRLQNSGSPRAISAAQHRPVLETYSTPFLYTVFNLFAQENYDAAYARYSAVHIGAMVVGVLLLGRTLRFSWTTSLLMVAFVGLAFDPLHSDLRVANVNALQLLAIAAFLWLQRPGGNERRDLLSGLLLGAGVAFKPNSAYLILLVGAILLVDRRWIKLALIAAGTAAGVLAAILLSAARFGSLQCWRDWAHAVSSLGSSQIISVRLGNYALTRLIFESTGLQLAPYLALALVAVTLVVAFVSRKHAATHPEARLWLMAGIGCVVPLLGEALAWIHYFLLALPLAMLLLRSGSRPRWPFLATCLALFLLAARSYGPATAYPLAALLLLGAGLHRLYAPPQFEENC